MALIHWQPFREIETIHRQIDKIFDEVFNSINYSIAEFSQPVIELKETTSELILQAEIPSINAKDLDVYIAPLAVSITGKIYDDKTTKRGYYQAQLDRKFQHIIYLPIPVKNEEVKADFQNGILTLVLPKDNTEYKVVKINLAKDKPALPSSDSPKVIDVPVQRA